MSLSEPGVVTGEVPITVIEAVDFDLFYRDARPSVIRALRATIGSADLAIESADEALARAYQRWERVSRLDNPTGWVYRVGLNYSRNRIRQLMRRRNNPMPASGITDGADVIVADPSIEAALASLSVDHRAVVVCRFLLGWSEHRTAEALGVRPGTVKSRLSRALSKLERKLDHLQSEEA